LKTLRFLLPLVAVITWITPAGRKRKQNLRAITLRNGPCSQENVRRKSTPANGHDNRYSFQSQPLGIKTNAVVRLAGFFSEYLQRY
jgi:hypothetical protein